jgi:hypothetical protein
MEPMDEQALARIEQLLQDTLEVAEENNKLLLQMQRTARWAFIGKIILWIVLLGLPLLFLGPLLNALFPYTSAESGSVFGLPSPEQLEQLMSTYQSATQTP